MRYFDVGDINGQSLYTLHRAKVQKPPDGPWRAVAIGPDSLVDCVLIDGVRLSAGRVMILDPSQEKFPRIEPVRSVRTDDDQADDADTQPNARLQLALYEACDDIAAIGPRSPCEKRAAIVANAGVWQRVLRLPYQGRSMAKFTVRTNTDPGDASTDDVALIGVNYIPREVLKPILESVTDSEAGRVLLLQDTYAFRNAALAAIVTSTSTNEDTFIVGGTDNGEVFDEIEVWVRSARDGRAWGEAYDRSSAGAM